MIRAQASYDLLLGRSGMVEVSLRSSMPERCDVSVDCKFSFFCPDG